MRTELRIVTDSSAHLDEEFVREHDILVVPMTVELDGKEYREGVDIDASEFVRALTESNTLPNLIAPSPRAWADVYNRLVRETSGVLVLTHSARLSQAFENARAGVEYVFGRARFWVVDTQTIDFGLAVLVKHAARFAAEGLPAPEVVRRVRAMIPHVYGQFLMERLDYLEKYGRVGPAQSLLGTMLGIKPLVVIEDGDLIPIEKARQVEEGIEKLHDFVIEFLNIRDVSIVQHNMEDETALLLERLEMTLGEREFPVQPYSASLAVHLGPRALGVMVYEGMDERI